ncbi:MAG: ribokinase [Microbacteriaceae bacterium]
MSVVVLGSANLDLVYQVDTIPLPGETVLANGFEQHPGGKGNNQVTAVARAGAEVTFVAALGTDAAGEVLLASLRASGVHEGIRRVDQPTGTALITVDAHAENTIVVNSGANAALREVSEGELAMIRRADYLLLQLETPLPTVVTAAAAARKAGTRVVLNASPVRDLPGELMENIDLLVVNEHEAERLSGETARAKETVLPGGSVQTTVQTKGQAADSLLSLVPAVVITLGPAGSLVAVRGEAPAVVAGIRVDAVDTTGAGDTFCGALVAALDTGGLDTGGLDTGGSSSERVLALDSLISAAEFATAAAALSVQLVGAVPSIPTRAQVMHFRRTL